MCSYTRRLHPIMQTHLLWKALTIHSVLLPRFNHVTHAGSYQSSVINIFSHGFYFNCICKLDPATDIRAYLMLTIIYDFMAFTSLYYRFRLNYKPASVSRLSVYRDELLRCIADYSNHINIDNESALEFEALKEIFRAVIKNASPIPHLPADGNVIQFTTPLASRKRAASPVSFQSPEGHTVTKRPRFSEGHDEASDNDEGEARLLFSPVTHARPQSEIIDLSLPVYPTPLSPSKLNDVTDINFFASIPLNAMHNTETTIIMDSSHRHLRYVPSTQCPAFIYYYGYGSIWSRDQAVPFWYIWTAQPRCRLHQEHGPSNPSISFSVLQRR